MAKFLYRTKAGYSTHTHKDPFLRILISTDSSLTWLKEPTFFFFFWKRHFQNKLEICVILSLLIPPPPKYLANGLTKEDENHGAFILLQLSARCSATLSTIPLSLPENWWSPGGWQLKSERPGSEPKSSLIPHLFMAFLLPRLFLKWDQTIPVSWEAISTFCQRQKVCLIALAKCLF